jgi:hypothetical protein
MTHLTLPSSSGQPGLEYLGHGDALNDDWGGGAEEEAEDVGEEGEAVRDLPVLQQEPHPPPLPLLVRRVPGLPQVLPQDREVPRQHRLLVAERVEGIFP